MCVAIMRILDLTDDTVNVQKSLLEELRRTTGNTYIHTFICLYIHAYTQIHAYIHTCMHTYIHT